MTCRRKWVSLRGGWVAHGEDSGVQGFQDAAFQVLEDGSWPSWIQEGHEDESWACSGEHLVRVEGPRIHVRLRWAARTWGRWTPLSYVGTIGADYRCQTLLRVVNSGSGWGES